MVRRAIICIAIVAGLVAVAWHFSREEQTSLPPGFRREVRHLWAYGSRDDGVKGWIKERLHDFSTRRPGRGTTPLQLDGATMCWGYSNPTSAWFQFGDLVGKSNLTFWEFALAETRTVTGAIAELSSVSFHGLDSNYWAGRLGNANVAFSGRTVGKGGIRIETNRVLLARHIVHTNAVQVLRLKSFEQGRWGAVLAEFQIGSVSLDRKNTP